MNLRMYFAALSGVLLLTGLVGTARADIAVRFVAPERYVDACAAEAERARNLVVLERHIRAVAGACVADDEQLIIEVLDVDLAGDVDWSAATAVELRVLREVSWPRLELRYILVNAQGQVVRQAHEEVSDMDYLRHSSRARLSRGTLPYERLMLENWAARSLCRPAP